MKGRSLFTYLHGKYIQNLHFIKQIIVAIDSFLTKSNRIVYTLYYLGYADNFLILQESMRIFCVNCFHSRNLLIHRGTKDVFNHFWYYITLELIGISTKLFSRNRFARRSWIREVGKQALGSV